MNDQTKTDQLLVTRATTHGEFASNADAEMDMVRIFEAGDQAHTFTSMHRVALRMIAHKLARAINGDPFFAEHWDDIAGYARLVSQRIASGQIAREPVPVMEVGRIRDRPPILVAMEQGARVRRRGTKEDGTLDGSGTVSIGGDLVGVKWDTGKVGTASHHDLEVLPTSMPPIRPDGEQVCVLRAGFIYEGIVRGHEIKSLKGDTTVWYRVEVPALDGSHVTRDAAHVWTTRTEALADSSAGVVERAIAEPFEMAPISNPTPEKNPIRATDFEHKTMEGTTVKTGSQKGKQWRDLYAAAPHHGDGRWVMLDEFIAEYGQ